MCAHAAERRSGSGRPDRSGRQQQREHADGPADDAAREERDEAPPAHRGHAPGHVAGRGGGGRGGGAWRAGTSGSAVGVRGPGWGAEPTRRRGTHRGGRWGRGHRGARVARRREGRTRRARRRNIRPRPVVRGGLIGRGLVGRGRVGAWFGPTDTAERTKPAAATRGLVALIAGPRCGAGRRRGRRLDARGRDATGGVGPQRLGQQPLVTHRGRSYRRAPTDPRTARDSGGHTAVGSAGRRSAYRPSSQQPQLTDRARVSRPLRRSWKPRPAPGWRST